jgi:hypothetical protein
MFNQVFYKIYRYFLEIYESFIKKKDKKSINKYEECGDEEYLYFNQEEHLIYSDKSIDSDKDL